MAKTIKGFKINDQKYGLNLTQIGSYIDSGSTEVEITDYIETKIDENGGDTPSGTLAELVSSDGSKFDLKVNNNSELYAEKQLNIGKLIQPTTGANDLNTQYNKLYINSFYCGGDNSNEHTINYCTHHFVELSNLTDSDINLSGLSLQYRKSGGAWSDVLPLNGIIKSHSTFLIRGGVCSNYDCAKIKIDKYDMEWRNTEGDLVKFSDVDAPSFLLCFGVESFGNDNPGWSTFDKNSVSTRLIDLIGVNTFKQASSFETKAYGYNKESLRTALFKKYYAMDLVDNAYKALNKRNNSSEWMYIDLSKDNGDLVPCIEDYTPRSRRENKNMYYDKTKLLEDKPSIITCSFGIQATDNGEGATRCFNWVSKGIHNEYIWIRTKGTEEWGEAHESFKNEIGNRKYYNRLNVEYGDGIVFTVHKYIQKGLPKGEYEYIAGRANRDKTPILDYCTEPRTFVVRNNEDVANGFKFLQTSDQQGFTLDEYIVWEGSTYPIGHEERSKDVEFMINTGDMTQNGSRMNEWLDYFNGKDNFLNGLEEMATIGNNDMSPKNSYEIVLLKDSQKVSLDNFKYFYTYEMDETNFPVFEINSQEYYIPSLYSFNYGNTHFMCVLSEIKQTTETEVYGFENYGNFYPEIKKWCEKDLENNSEYKWNVAFCHEMPFSILTQAKTNDPSSIYDARMGANINGNAKEGDEFWFTEFCQNNNIRLVMGGHKHTQSTSWPILENVVYNEGVREVIAERPIIVLSDNEEDFQKELTEITNAVSKTPVENMTLIAISETDKRKYPSTWFAMNEETKKLEISSELLPYIALCEFKQVKDLEEGVTPVVYAMSQATGYKHTSNKELPSKILPWLRNYYPQTGQDDGKKDTANPQQKFPFYTIWTITNENIEGDVRKVVGAFGGKQGSSDGIFDINTDGEYVLNKKCATEDDHNKFIYTINGLKSGIDKDSTDKVIIK